MEKLKKGLINVDGPITTISVVLCFCNCCFYGNSTGKQRPILSLKCSRLRQIHLDHLSCYSFF